MECRGQEEISPHGRADRCLRARWQDRGDGQGFGRLSQQPPEAGAHLRTRRREDSLAGDSLNGRFQSRRGLTGRQPVRISTIALSMAVGAAISVAGCSGDRVAKTDPGGTAAQSGLAMRVEGLAEDVQTDLHSGAWTPSAEKLRQLRAARDSTVMALRSAGES